MAQLNLNNINEISIGSGMTYPITLSQGENGVGWYPVTGDTKLIENNLETILNYQIGEKLREEFFGTRLWECLEEPNSQAQSFLINQFLRRAFASWESRIYFNKSVITREGSKLKITFYYTVIATNSSMTGTLVYDNLNNSLEI